MKKYNLLYNKSKFNKTIRERKRKKWRKKKNLASFSCFNYKISFIFIIVTLFIFEIFQFNQYDEENIILNPKNVEDLLKAEKVENFELQKEILCFPTDNKLYWNNQTNLDEEKLRDYVLNSKFLRINFENTTLFYKRKNPKISLIITLYNQEKYIKNIYANIQQQELKDIEIIFVDDASTDNSSFIIKDIMKSDKRIVYIKNPINRKQYYSINIGILYSKGEYILSCDPDDLILNNILLKAYETAKQYNLDILEFYMFIRMTAWKKFKYKSGTICKNENVRNLFYYGRTRNLPDKLVRRIIYIKSIQFMSKELYYLDYHAHTDDTIFFGLIHYARSYGFLEQVGYYYNTNSNRKTYIQNKKNKIEIYNEELRSLFNIMKYFILKSDNSSIEKNNIAYKFFDEKVREYLNHAINHINKEFEFYIEVLDLYINCKYFAKEKKDIFNNIKNQIVNKLNKFKNYI